MFQIESIEGLRWWIEQYSALEGVSSAIVPTDRTPYDYTRTQ